ncbi:Protein of unknown function [Microlunatus sagamiharensis]|jgi:F0F1-type ATP synthase membrane subunit c/vacuolar-type H+-ATPase subunit K|uniref:DUF4235 domain-containing protein n=1 Tax=Microlunatus sagamiharensis TaxID=546874 RepID=A0A1H2M6A0_9ACTN|nr:DUF4235 domain-containing protein [Microlunatus sagamiharensis]SDU88644.1 Protein of unknown function [Microlunatus sagamiharensis]
MVNAAQLAYRPVGILTGIAAGAVAGAIFKQVWKRVARQDDAPDALQSEYTLARVIVAATIQGAIFAAVKATVDRLGAQGFQKLTGEWPGD